MKSRISIDVDHDNQPIIKVEYHHSDDVRDKLVAKFLETFAGGSMFATFYYVGDSSSGKTSIIRPIPVENLTLNVEIMSQAAEHYEKNYRLTDLEQKE